MSHNTDILAQNYTYLKSKSELLSDAMEGIFSEAAVLWEDLMKNPPTPDDVSRIFNEITGKTSDILSVEFADLCLAFAEHYESSLETLFDDDIVESIATPKIAYLQNSFSNRAYRSFSRVFDKVSSVYFSGFREVCEEVYYGRASHAILPVFSTHDGPLISFRKLISKYDLKIILETDVETNDDSVMRFALLKKGLFTQSSPEFLDISVILPDNASLGTFLSSCERMGMDALMTNSHPLEYSNDRYGLNIQFDIRKADLTALTLFLEGSHIRYDILGVYNILN